jgi:hypothetical protein
MKKIESNCRRATARKTPDPRKRKRYQPPRIAEEVVFETLALFCDREPGQSQCKPAGQS